MIIPDDGKTHLIIGDCKNITVKFNIKNIGPPTKRVVRFNGIINQIQFNCPVQITRRKRWFTDMPKFHVHLEKKLINWETLVVNVHTVIIQIKNINSKNDYLPKNNKLNIVQKYKKNCYLTSAENVSLAVSFRKIGFEKP